MQKVRTSEPGSCFELQLFLPHPDEPRVKSASRTADPSQAPLFEMLSASRTLIFDDLPSAVYGLNWAGESVTRGDGVRVNQGPRRLEPKESAQSSR